MKKKLCPIKLCPVCCLEMITEWDEYYGEHLICPDCGYPFGEGTETYAMKHLSDMYPLPKKKVD